MTIQIYTNRIVPETTAAQLETSQKQLEAILPLKADKIDEVNQEAIIPDGTRWGPDMIDIPALREALAAGNTTLDMTKLSTLLGLVVQYKDGISFYVTPGQVLLNGVLKLQELDEATTKFRIVNAAVSLIPGECQPSTPGVSGLDPDTWYYVYADTSVATTYPGIQVTSTRWKWGAMGPLHPENTKLRGIASLRTDEDGNIRAFHRYHNGRVFWREIGVGPLDPTTNINVDGASSIDISDDVPPTADAAFMTFRVDNGPHEITIGTKGDVDTASGYRIDSGASHSDSATWLEIPVHVIDPVTDAETITTEVYLDSDSDDNMVAVAGYHEPII